MNIVVALDLGTTGNRAIAFDSTGKIVCRHYQEFTQIYPQAAWVEHNPMEIWAGVQTVLGHTIADVGRGNIAAIGITNQRETTVVWDRNTGLPVYNAIVWQCRRTADRCTALADHREWIQKKTGLVLDAYFSATKIEWILNHLPPGTDRQALKFGTIDTWILDRLTGGTVHATDPSNASRTMLWNIHTRDFDAELLDLFQIPTTMLPEVRPSNSIFGITADTGIPITGILGDQQASLFGQAGWESGVVKNTYGTGLFAMTVCPNATPITPTILTTVAWQIDNDIRYAKEGSVFIGGSLIQWLRDGLGIIKESGDIEELASESGTADGVVIVPAFVGLGAPHWDADARGMIIGITRRTSKSNIAYAALEAIAFQSLDIIQVLTGTPSSASQLRVDGGACQNNLLMQIQANILGIPVERPTVTETTALGVAMMAGLGAQIWPPAILPQIRKIEHIFNPAPHLGTPISRWADAVNRSKGWAS